MAEEIVATGGLIPDDIMLKILTSRLDLLHNKVRVCALVQSVLLKATPQHWILDGFPRTLGQGKLFDEHLRYVSHDLDSSPRSLLVCFQATRNTPQLGGEHRRRRRDHLEPHLRPLGPLALWQGLQPLI